MTTPTARFIHGIDELGALMIAACSEILYPDDRRGSDDFINRAIVACRTAARHVRGNRSPDLPPTWDDLRLVLASRLRICAQYLEDV